MSAPPSPTSLATSLAAEGLAPALAAAAFLAATTFATIRAGLSMTVADRVLAHVPTGARKERLSALLARVDALSTSATLLTKIAQVLFLLFVLESFGEGGVLRASELGLAVVVAAAGMVLSAEVLPPALARAGGERLVLAVLPTFAALQAPLFPLRRGVELLRGMILRVLRVPDEEPATRRLLAGLRGALSEVAPDRDLDEQERELIENVIEFRDADAVEVMTPRTEVHAVEAQEGLEGALRVAVDTGCSRLPVYVDSIDTIVGTVSALDLSRAREEGEAGEAALRALVRPPFLIPETKLLSELLKELRQRREKMAVVVDEYGGTAGIVTVTDVLRELVGEIPEVDAEHEQVLELESGLYEVPATLHVTEVNEALGLELPEEEDFETLAGFVLARLGHLPKVGELLHADGLEIRVVEASDRRVLKVHMGVEAPSTAKT